MASKLAKVLAVPTADRIAELLLAVAYLKPRQIRQLARRLTGKGV
jgi:hypothetical protein